MLTLMPDIKRFPFGEYAVARYSSDTPGERYTFSVYSTNLQLYMDSAFGFTSATPVLFNASTITLPTGDELQKIAVNTSTLATNDLLYVTIQGDGNGTDTNTYTTYFQIGSELIADTNITVQVYGFLRDAYGEFIKNVPVTFTVMNSSVYFDNSPTTMVYATTLTDSQGKFTINLNRNYDYVLNIEKLNYVKVIKLSTLPATATVVEVDLGTGLGC